jgi:hypothetical protein
LLGLAKGGKQKTSPALKASPGTRCIVHTRTNALPGRAARPEHGVQVNRARQGVDSMKRQ